MTKLPFEKIVKLRLLLTVEGIGPAKIRNLLAYFKSFDNIFEASIKEIASAEGVSKVLAQRIKEAFPKLSSMSKELEVELNDLQRINGRILSAWDKEYPQLLKKIYDPPLLLYIKGELTSSEQNSIAMVGTRVPTNYGKIQAERIASNLAENGITIISGMARGVDSASHKAALKAKGRTVAIIGSGLDVIYPPENKKLFEEIIESGAVISEYPLKTKPDAMNFPKRNRIISGMSLGTIVIETGLKGGALQTAEFALDQGRDVFAVPGNLGIKQSEGTNLLIQKGEAKLIINADDVLNELNLKIKPVEGKNIPKSLPDLSFFEEKIHGILSNDAIHIDKIAELTQLSTSDCLVNLLQLEFKSLVKQLPGKNFIKL